ncbi:MAG: hypothetical protein ACYTHN_13520, partial [Planctomycetota bacterium]
PQGRSVTLRTLRVGCNDCPPGNGWFYYPPYRHGIRVRGSLTVNQNTFIWDDTLEIDGGTLTNYGLFVVGNNTGYQLGIPNMLTACRISAPRLVMKGASATLICRYSASASSSPYCGGLIFWPGSIEEITEGNVHIEGWLIGADDTTCPYAPTPRLFDLTAPSSSSASITFDGINFPLGQAAPPTVYIQDESGFASFNNLKFNRLIIDRPGPGERRIDFISHLEIHRDFILRNGHVQAPAPRALLFLGAQPGSWSVTESIPGNSILRDMVPDLNGKTGPITLHSTLRLPGFTVDNPFGGFELIIDDRGAVMESLKILDGRMRIDWGTLEVHGAFQVGSSNPPLPSNKAPAFDLFQAGMLWVRGLLGGVGHGDFRFERGATGSLDAGTIRAEGDFIVDHRDFTAGGTHRVEMWGNIGRTVQIGNLQTPPGRICPTLILNDLIIGKTGDSPGNQVDVISDIETRGTCTTAIGVLNWNRDTIGVLTVEAGSVDPPAIRAAPGALKVPLLHLKVTANLTEAITFASFTCTANGSGDAGIEIAGAVLVLDGDGDGVYDPQNDPVIAGPAFFSPQDQTCRFQFTRTLNAGSSESWFVAVDFYDFTREGSEFTLGFAADRDAVTGGAQSNRSAVVTGAPVWGGTCTVTAEAVTNPPAPRAGGGCRGGSIPGGPESPLGWALLALAFILLKRRMGFATRTGRVPKP